MTLRETCSSAAIHRRLDKFLYVVERGVRSVINGDFDAELANDRLCRIRVGQSQIDDCVREVVDLQARDREGELEERLCVGRRLVTLRRYIMGGSLQLPG